MERKEIVKKLTQEGLVAGCITTNFFNHYNFTSEDTIIFEDKVLIVETDLDIIIMYYEDIYDITTVIRK